MSDQQNSPDKAEKELRRKIGLLEEAPICNKIIDLDSRLLYMNRAGARRLKIPDIEPYYGQIYPPEFYSESMRAVLIEHLERAKAGNISSVESPVLDLEGNEVWFHTTYMPALNEAGEIECVIAISVDITENVSQRNKADAALHRSEERFRSIFEQAAVGVAMIDSKTGIFKRINQRYCDMVGYSLEEMTGDKSFQEITHPDDLQDDLDNMARLMAGEIQEFNMDKRYYRKDGPIVWVDLTVSSVKNLAEEGQYHIAVVQDITARKQAELEREAAIEKLEQAQSEIKTLRGIIPICSYCKGVRNDKGAWEKLETYITHHSDAYFSHGICPECVLKYDIE